jgi:hypothetical protein
MMQDLEALHIQQIFMNVHAQDLHEISFWILR